ncbi:uncharacterized protein KGF55_005155 [Candida pseudojiufengensis]|uniref:uncharacterized protein n=1 Tax=Candida pseudojiufengensis TaxID=497109 RepID=UPI00222588CC|nr:uncharacterized protein KGF55_005155 [Candida pseudojiufengensis]KAI5959923.1 hypothetical protein KGF55_005155 [Candida pseudojiufengensis]
MESPSSSRRKSESSVNYLYGHHHKRSDSIDLGRKGSVSSILSLHQSQSANSTPPASPQNQYRSNFYKSRREPYEYPQQQQSQQTLQQQQQSSLGLVPELQVIDLDKITEEFKKNQRILAQKEVHWCNFLKEVPIETSNLSPTCSSKLPETSEILLDRYNSDYNIKESDVQKKEKAIRKALSKFRFKD